MNDKAYTYQISRNTEQRCTMMRIENDSVVMLFPQFLSFNGELGAFGQQAAILLLAVSLNN